MYVSIIFSKGHSPFVFISSPFAHLKKFLLSVHFDNSPLGMYASYYYAVRWYFHEVVYLFLPSEITQVCFIALMLQTLCFIWLFCLLLGRFFDSSVNVSFRRLQNSLFKDPFVLWHNCDFWSLLLCSRQRMNTLVQVSVWDVVAVVYSLCADVISRIVLIAIVDSLCRWVHLLSVMTS